MKINLRPTRIEAFFYAVLIQFLLFGLYFAHTNLEYFEGVFAVEDGLVEWLTVTWLLACSALCLVRAVKLRKRRPKFFIGMLVFFSLVFFFGAGEEVSWGQRIFDVTPSEFFQANNAQGETNLHNLVVGETKINKLIFGLTLGILIAIYCLVLPTLTRKVPAVKRLVDKFAIPIARGHHVIAYLLIFLLVELNPSPKRGELLEFGGTLMFFLMFFNPWNRRSFEINPVHRQHNNNYRHRNNNYRGRDNRNNKPRGHNNSHRKNVESKA